ncbi:uncharacterized protein A4U43_C07F27060 [Asparagus officinalis]|uniref:Uncharacterized protein n=1 Tax=Asparagus officinalis TaxID=4686 RepID=A0A5P1EKF7_ASPOF|nr:uncharacterized protein A4U43_C07F27060 [Asparagus officinalis]
MLPLRPPERPSPPGPQPQQARSPHSHHIIQRPSAFTGCYRTQLTPPELRPCLHLVSRTSGAAAAGGGDWWRAASDGRRGHSSADGRPMQPAGASAMGGRPPADAGGERARAVGAANDGLRAAGCELAAIGGRATTMTMVLCGGGGRVAVGSVAGCVVVDADVQRRQ